MTLERPALEYLPYRTLLVRKSHVSPMARSHLDVYASEHACQIDLAGQKFDGNPPLGNCGFALARGSASAFVNVRPVNIACGSPGVDK